MNLTLQKISFIFLSLLIISSCSTYNFEDQMPDELVEDVDKQEEVSIREIPFSDIMDDIQQGFMLNGYSNYRLENNQLNTAFGKLGNGMVKELKDYRFEVIRTAIPIIPNEFNPNAFYNLVITKPLKGQKAPKMVIVEYVLENEEYTSDFDFSNYTGYIRTYSLNGEIINDIRMIDGKQATIANTRTENICGYEYELRSATICVGPDDDYCSTQYYWDTIPFECAGTPMIDGGGGGSGGGTPVVTITDGSDGNPAFIEYLDPNFTPGQKYSYNGITKSKRLALLMNLIRYANKNNIPFNISDIFEGLRNSGSPHDTFSGTIITGGVTVHISYLEIGVTPNYRNSNPFPHQIEQVLMPNGYHFNFYWASSNCGGCSNPLWTHLIQVKNNDYSTIYNFLIGN